METGYKMWLSTINTLFKTNTVTFIKRQAQCTKHSLKIKTQFTFLKNSPHLRIGIS
jgi:hypothetical protein